jgi:uncharacterized protein (DUF362 family)
MKRRDFIVRGLGAGVVGGVVAGLGASTEAFAGNFNGMAAVAAGPFDLVAVMGGEPDVMFDKGIAALGGMQAFVKKGQTVVIKPNIGFDKTPELGANTNPILVGQIVKHCLKAGAKEVLVFDHTLNNPQKCYTNSGIEKAVTDAGGKMVPGNSDSMYKTVEIAKGKRLTTTKVHEIIVSCDVFINVPVLKNHGGARMSSSMKNLMGIVWERRSWHGNDLHQSIADMATWRKPDLNVIDAYRVMTKNGPQGVSLEDVMTVKAQVLSRDMVAADAAAAKFLNYDPKTIDYIVKGHAMGVGNMDIETLKIHKIKV